MENALQTRRTVSQLYNAITMADIKNKGGRPFLTEAQQKERKELLLLKLEPYLKSGLSINKALKETNIHNSELYKYMKEDRLFGEKIAKFRQYISVLANHIIVTELLSIVEKQNGNEAKNIKPQALGKGELDFLWWYALNANVCREEWGRRQNVTLYDPELELQRVKQLINTTVEERVSRQQFV